MTDVPFGTVLVTGSDGFVGAHIVRELADRGYDVVATWLSSPNGDICNWWESTTGAIQSAALNVCDADAVSALYDRHRPKTIIHAAAVTDPRTGVLDDVNFHGTKNVFSAPGPEKKIYVSTASVYDESATKSAQLHEEGPTVSVPRDRSAWTYAESKRAAELWVLDQADATYKIARVVGCFGPLERPSRNRTVMSAGFAVARAIRDGQYDAEIGPCSSDLTYVRDIAAGIVALIEAPSQHLIVNIATFNTTSLEELAGIAKEAALPDFPLTVGRNKRVAVDKLRSIQPPEQHRIREAFDEYLAWLADHEY